jgi:uncharacterized lipoprotein YddW (UPF0748 family)
MKLRLAVLFCCFLSCTAMPPRVERTRELRGVWVATVANLDWPSRRDLTPDEQRRELTAMFDRFAELGLNAVFLQVRPAADAIYPSALEPWSEFLTGTIGRDPGWDPLAFAVQEAHARGLELHAWFNPFRARHSSQTSPIPTGPHLVPYGQFVWLDPGDENVRRNTIAVVVDVVKRYDVDGVHMDDYFYPYPVAGIEFDDDRTYRESGSGLSRADWRRRNVNHFIRDLHRAVKDVRPGVEVGISPFGIWRPGHPPQIEGFDAYDGIYADARLWLQRGWVDYLAPQLYWPIAKREQSFPVLLRWWVEQDRHRRGIVAGMSVNRVASGRPNSVPPEEIARQLALVRAQKGASGFILFSARTLMEDRAGIAGVVREGLR